MQHSIKDSNFGGFIVDDLKLNTIQVECPTKCSLALPAVYGQGLVIFVMYLQLVALDVLKSRGTAAISTNLKTMKLSRALSWTKAASAKLQVRPLHSPLPLVPVHLLIESLGTWVTHVQLEYSACEFLDRRVVLLSFVIRSRIYPPHSPRPCLPSTSILYISLSLHRGSWRLALCPSVGAGFAGEKEISTVTFVIAKPLRRYEVWGER